MACSCLPVVAEALAIDLAAVTEVKLTAIGAITGMPQVKNRVPARGLGK